MIEAIEKVVPDKVKKYFPINTHSLKELIERVKTENVQSVEGLPFARFNRSFGEALLDRVTGVRHIRECEYGGLFTSKTAYGRRIQLEEKYATRFGSERGAADADIRGMYLLRLLVTVDSRLKRIRQEVPGVEVALVGPNGKMTESTYEKLQNAKEAYEAAPFLVAE